MRSSEIRSEVTKKYSGRNSRVLRIFATIWQSTFCKKMQFLGIRTSNYLMVRMELSRNSIRSVSHYESNYETVWFEVCWSSNRIARLFAFELRDNSYRIAGVYVLPNAIKKMQWAAQFVQRARQFEWNCKKGGERVASTKPENSALSLQNASSDTPFFYELFWRFPHFTKGDGAIPRHPRYYHCMHVSWTHRCMSLLRSLRRDLVNLLSVAVCRQ